jgi:formamidopyrimidine-DNA glycosylase
MPELPDIIVYNEALESYILNSPVEKLRIGSPFVVRSVEPPIGEVEGKRVRGIERLFHATRQTLTDWTERLRQKAGDAFPDKVTAFHPEMAVHGRYREPCPVCDAPVQRIRYAQNEVNYCAQCQTGGGILADRAMSRLLKSDWPRTLDEWEGRMGR